MPLRRPCCLAFFAAVVVAALPAAGAPSRAADAAPDAAAQPRWLVGDLHVHVSPPDAPGHSTLTVARAIDLARRADLDFVALTPHRADATVETADGASVSGWELVRRLAAEHLAASAAPTDGEAETAAASRPIVVIPGWEWTRASPGHLGVLFASAADVARRDRGAEHVLAAGGLVVVDHPFLGPVPSDDPLLRRMRADRRWKPFAASGGLAGAWNGIEVWHDRSVLVERLYGQRDEAPSETRMLSRSLAIWDAATAATRRRIVAVGGSDAHGRLPYTVAPLAVVSVRAVAPADADAAAMTDALRRGLRAAHVTFGRRGGAAARDFAATSDVAGERAAIGDSLRVREEVRLTWGGLARLIENGAFVGEFEGGAERRLVKRGAFAFWRIEKPRDAYSNMIYANLPEPPAGAR